MQTFIGHTGLWEKLRNWMTWSSTEAATGGVLWEKVFLEILKIHKKSPMQESLF